jgi:hypothetical protein
MKTMRLMIPVLVAAGAAAPALAADHLDVKPGLWSMSMNTEASGVPNMDLSKVPAAQRAMMQKMIAAQMGKALKPKTFKSCLTEEQLSKPIAFQGENDPSCEVIVKKSTPAEVQYSEECTGAHQRSVTADFKAASETSVTGKSHVVSQGMTIDVAISGTWVAADCGAVKPGHAQFQ